MKKLIHVNQHVIRSNRRNDAYDPIFTIKAGRRNTVAWYILIDGPSQLVYRPYDPLPCGAQAWIVTEAPVVADGRLIP